jgi:ACDE family multidrug resistance protein
MNNNPISLGTILCSSALIAATGVILAPALNLIREGLNIDPALSGLIISTHGLFAAFLSPVMGTLIDRIGTKKLLVAGLFLYGMTGGCGLVITSYWVLIMSRALLGIGIAAVFNATIVTLLNLHSDRVRNKIMGWRESANTFGNIVLPFIGGVLGGISWHLPFAVYLAGIPLGLLALITVPETISIEENTEKDSVLNIFKNNSILIIIYSIFFLTVVFLYTIVIFLPQLLGEMNISNPVHISIYIIAMATSSGITSLLYGKIKSTLSYKKIILITFSLWALAFIAISQVGSGGIIAASVVVCGIGYGMLAPALIVWASENSTIGFRGRITSYLVMSAYIGQFSCPLIFGPVVLWWGLNAVFLTVGAICAVMGLVLCVWMHK